MKMGLNIFLFLSGVLFICGGLHVLGFSGPLTAKLGGSVMLPCYVEAPIPLEELEVEWKRTDSEALVHLFQERESKPEAQDQAYSGRASFFTEEVERGNFSLLLTNLTTKDAGVYNCSVYSQQETGQTSVEVKKLEYLIVTGGHAVSGHAHEDVTLNCSVDSHIPPKELEDLMVAWKKVDQEITVLVFQEGEVQEDFTHERFRDRVEFFGPEEIHKGNFSLRIKYLQTEDKGLYRCEVLSGEFSANTIVEIMQLGFSHIHNMILFLCGFTCLCGSVLLLGCIPYTICKEPGSCTVITQHVLVFCPNILMFVAFVLWGVLQGFLSEAATCLTINLLRILRLLLFSSYVYHFHDKIQRLIKMTPILEFVVLSIIAAVAFGLHAWGVQDKALMGFAGCVLVSNIIIFLVAILDKFLPDSKRTRLLMYARYGLVFLQLCTDFPILVVLFVTTDVAEPNGNKGLICLFIFSCILMVVHSLIEYYGSKSSYPRSNSRNQMSQPSRALIRRPFTIGAAVLFLVNSVSLAVELIRQAGKGERTVEDLRLILLPFEMAFVIVCALSNRNAVL